MKQAEFSFGSGDEHGFIVWRQVCDKRIQESRSQHGLPLNQRVRVKLRDFDQSFTGWLMESTLPNPGSAVRFQLANLAFDFGIEEIESCIPEKSTVSNSSL